MPKYSSKIQFQQAVEEAELKPPPSAPYMIDVKGYGNKELWAANDAVLLLEALARVSGESLRSLVLSDTSLFKRELLSEDDWEWRDITPPEADAWHWPALDESMAERGQTKNRRRGSKRRGSKR